MTRTFRRALQKIKVYSILYRLKKTISKSAPIKPKSHSKRQLPSQGKTQTGGLVSKQKVQVHQIHLSLEDAKAKVKKLNEQIKSQEVKGNKSKRKRLYHQLAQLNKALQDPDTYIVDPEEKQRKIAEDQKRRFDKKIKQSEERKKKEKNEQRHKKRCLHCGSKDHMLSECPKTDSGFCYKCGSTQHLHTECFKQKFQFANCFVCGQKGHISRECLQNEKGLYRKGGSCFGCGSVRHTLKECPKRHSGAKFVNQEEEF